MEQEEPLHLPDFRAPDFAQPALERTDLAQPGFVLPDPALAQWPRAYQAPSWPDEMDRVASERPDPATPDLLEPDRPNDLSYPAANAHLLSEPEYAPDVVMQQRPGELDPAAMKLAPGSPDDESLPAGLAYPQLYTNDDEMTRRKRHFAILELGLEREARDHHAG